MRAIAALEETVHLPPSSPPLSLSPSFSLSDFSSSLVVWSGWAGRVGFGKDMRAIAALEEGKGEKTAVDFASLAGAEGENYMQDPLRAFKIWRAVCGLAP